VSQVKLYVRLARTPRARDGWKVEATTSPNPRALTVGQGAYSAPVHTLRFALLLDVPDHLLRPADWPVIEVEVPDEAVGRIPVEVEVLPS
jgi:hypothetical protein